MQMNWYLFHRSYILMEWIAYRKTIELFTEKPTKMALVQLLTKCRQKVLKKPRFKKRHLVSHASDSMLGSRIFHTISAAF